MNQSILFNDDIQINIAEGEMIFTAMVSGMIVPCLIKGRFKSIEQAKENFQAHQFDYEIQAEQLIEEECYSAKGEVHLDYLGSDK